MQCHYCKSSDLTLWKVRVCPHTWNKIEEWLCSTCEKDFTVTIPKHEEIRAIEPERPKIIRTVLVTCPSGFRATIRLDQEWTQSEVIRAWLQEGGHNMCQALDALDEAVKKAEREGVWTPLNGVSE